MQTDPTTGGAPRPLTPRGPGQRRGAGRLGARAKPWVLWGLLALGQGCGDPCRDLSDTVCNCMPSRMEQQACRKRVRNLAAQGTAPSSGERQICHDLMQSCSCEALAQGDFSACGLAQD